MKATVSFIVALCIHNADMQSKHQQFIASLFYSNEYFQCIAEARRYNLLYGEDMDYTVALCYVKGNQLLQASSVLHNKPNKQFHDYLLLSTIYSSMHQYSHALHTLSLCDSKSDLSSQMLLYKNVLAVHVAMNNWYAALNFYTQHSDALKELQGMYQLLNKAKHDTINPYTASFFALVPGAGHVYVRRYTDGLISLLTIGVLAGATFYSYTKGNVPLMYTFGVLTALGYAGNIYSAYNSALYQQQLINSNYRTQLYNEYLRYNPEIFLPQWMKQ